MLVGATRRHFNTSSHAWACASSGTGTRRRRRRGSPIVPAEVDQSLGSGASLLGRALALRTMLGIVQAGSVSLAAPASLSTMLVPCLLIWQFGQAALHALIPTHPSLLP